jgi:hypothetical protein
MKKRTEAVRVAPIEVVGCIRAEIEAKRAERDELAGASPPRAVLAAGMEECLSASAERAERVMFAHVATLDYTTESLLSARVTTVRDGIDRVDLLPAMIAVLGIDTVRKGLSRFIARAEDGPSPAERAERLAAIDAEILSLEQAEERAIRSFEAAGIDIVRRGDASPAIVLSDL